MKLQRYLDRIGYSGSARPDVRTLKKMQLAHVCSVPFENLDVQLGRPLSISVEDAFQKIVIDRRGGWCYEQNGLFGWALSEIGFSVMRVAAGVMRDERGGETAASHLCLLVVPRDSTSRYLVDVGFGGSMLCPIELLEGKYDQPPFKIGLQRLDDGYWRFWESTDNEKFSYDLFSYDFKDESADESALAAKCDFLQQDPSSNFVLNLVAQRRLPDRHYVLRGKVFTDTRPGKTTSRTLQVPEQLLSVLDNEFRIDVPEIAAIWRKIEARHEELFAKD